MCYMVLRDSWLHIYTDEQSYKRSSHCTVIDMSRASHCTNSIHVQHALAAKATDYTKKKHVFRLQTADLAQYLIQTSDVTECQDWIDAINLIAALYSAPVQCDVISTGSAHKRFQRPLVTVSGTQLSLKEQLRHHEQMVCSYEQQLTEFRKTIPDKTSTQSRYLQDYCFQLLTLQDYCKMENYLKFEVKRYRTYVRLLHIKMAATLQSNIEHRFVDIGELDEYSTASTTRLAVTSRHRHKQRLPPS